MNIKKYYSKHQRLTKALSFDVITKGLGFLFIPLFLKCMTKEEFGLYSYLIFAIINFSYLLKGGLDTSLTKLYFDYHGRDKGKVVFTISISILGIFLLFFLFCLFSKSDDWFFQKITSGRASYNKYFLPVMLYILLYNIAAVLNNYYVAASSVGTFQKWNLIRVVAQNLFAYILIRMAVGSDNAAVRLLSESLAGIFFLLPLVMHFSKKLVFEFDAKILKRALSIGLPTLGGVVMGLIYTFCDKYFLQKHAGIQLLAVYNLALLLATPVGILFGSFHLIWLSSFFQESNLVTSFKKTKKVYLRFLLVYGALFTLLFLAIWALLALNIIEKTYAEVLFIFPIVFLYRVLENLCQLYNNFLVKIEKTSFTLFLTVIISAIAITMYIKLIPIYGMYGSGFTLVLLEVIRTLILYFYTRWRVLNPQKLKRDSV